MKKNKTLLIALMTALILGAVFIYTQFGQEVDVVDETPVETTEALKEAAGLPEKAPVAPPEEKDSVTDELADAITELPTLGDLKNLDPEELHHTPEIVLEGGMLVGKMIEKAEVEPTRREPTLHFLKTCAEDPEVVPAVRAVCWKKTLTQIEAWKIFLPVADAKVPDEIKSLAVKLP